MARRHLKSPRWLNGKYLHFTLLIKWSRMAESHPLCLMSIVSPIPEIYGCFKIWPWKSMVMTKLKTNGQIWNEVLNRYVQFSFCGTRIILSQNTGKFHISPRKFKIRVVAKTKPIGHMWDRGFNQYVCFSFRDNRTTVGWDIANSIFNLRIKTHGQDANRRISIQGHQS